MMSITIGLAFTDSLAHRFLDVYSSARTNTACSCYHMDYFFKKNGDCLKTDDPSILAYIYQPHESLHEEKALFLSDFPWRSSY